MKKELKTKGYKARPSKAKLKESIINLQQEVLTLRREALDFVQEKQSLLRDVRILVVKEQEGLAVINFLRKSVVLMEEKLAD